MGNLLLIFTVLAWLALAAARLSWQSPRGEYMVGAGMMMLLLLAVFVLLNGLLTRQLNASGAFEWLSDNPSSRRILLIGGWGCIMAGTAFSVLNNPGTSSSATGALAVLEKMLSYGPVWMPLLQLAPYVLLSNASWRSSAPAWWYVAPLATGALIGLALLLAPRIIASMPRSSAPSASEKEALEATRVAIERETQVKKLVEYTQQDIAPFLKQAAIVKISALPDWEDQLLRLLHPDSLQEGHWAYICMRNLPLQHPDRFVEPVQQHLDALAALTRKTLARPDDNKYVLYYTDFKTVVEAIDLDLQAHREAFRPAIKNLLDALDTRPEAGQEWPQALADCQQRYKQVLEDWLR